MTQEDEALVMLTGIRPTKRNVVVSLGKELAAQYKKPQPAPNPGYFSTLTPVQKRMLELSHEPV